MPTRRVVVLALTCLLLLIGCTTSDGETDSDADGFSDKAEEEAGTDPNDNRSKPPGEPPSDQNEETAEEEPAEAELEESFVVTEGFAESGDDDMCNDGTNAVPCTGEFDMCAAGTIGDLAAVACDGADGRAGTVLSYTIQRQAVTADGIDIRHACQGEPEPGLTSCIFDVLDNGQSIFGQGCEYGGDLLDDALVLVLPATCGAVPDDVSQRIADSIDLSGQTSYAAAFLTEEGQPIYLRVGVMLPVELEDVIETIERAR